MTVTPQMKAAASGTIPLKYCAKKIKIKNVMDTEIKNAHLRLLY